MRALIVDDSRAIRSIVSRALKGIGWETAEATDGQDALAKLGTDPKVQLALVDWNMPQMDGLQFVLAVRGRAELASMRIMMITSEAEIERVQKALQAGADEYLMKPFTAEDIVEKLNILGLQA